jgi:hypothetical protein
MNSDFKDLLVILDQEDVRYLADLKELERS